MRVVGGRWKGRALASFSALGIRPTSDKVREAVFNILAARSGLHAGEHDGGFGFERVLDLYAGTGAMGIEALSRGALEAVFVDASVGAVKVIEKNLAAVGAAEARVIRKDSLMALKDLSRRGESFDLVFLDPPYSAGALERALGAVAESGVMAPGGVAVAETSKRAPLVNAPEGLEIEDSRRYGDTLVYILALKR